MVTVQQERNGTTFNLPVWNGRGCTTVTVTRRVIGSGS